MPELPDLQAFSRNLDKMLRGKKVKAVSVKSPKVKSPEKEFKKDIEGSKVSGIYRDGKQLYIGFDNKTVLGLHLMLHGGLHVFEGKNENRHTVLELDFEDGSGLALTDWQGVATPTLNPEEASAPDALSDEVNTSFWKEKLKGKASIKNVLLDQKVVRGIGNAYADEILWEAGISPFSVANKIPASKVTALSKAIRSVLVDAEKQILKSHPDIISGEVRDFLKIHNAKKKESPKGAAIKIKVNAGRKTYYTDEQELFE
ncbi:MAG: Fpg/Nei family DNA glycosylase [Chitinophagaceae bacterium]|nr:Fpg/Nei family DNA glycosylase [Chitinophagaceae bacterium]